MQGGIDKGTVVIQQWIRLYVIDISARIDSELQFLGFTIILTAELSVDNGWNLKLIHASVHLQSKQNLQHLRS